MHVILLSIALLASIGLVREIKGALRERAARR